jgi:neutral ceramidase
VTSATFDVVVAPLSAKSSAAIGSAGVSIVALLGGAPGLRALREGPSDGDVPLPGPWSVTAKMDDGSQQTASGTPDAKGAATVTIGGEGAAHVVSVDVRDASGNGGVIAAH